jgi:hypothetical protein
MQISSVIASLTPRPKGNKRFSICSICPAGFFIKNGTNGPRKQSKVTIASTINLGNENCRVMENFACFATKQWCRSKYTRYKGANVMYKCFMDNSIAKKAAPSSSQV